MAINTTLLREFRAQSMADKQVFINNNLCYASMRALAEHTRAYWCDMLDAMDDPELIAGWLREKGYVVTKQ